MLDLSAPDRVGQAIRNNAVWCDTICRAHGHAGEFLAAIWVNRHAAPRFYPNAITLTADRSAEQLAQIRALTEAGIPGTWAIKDSYSALDLAPLGFGCRFEASWLWRSSAPLRLEPEDADFRWNRIDGPAELAAWEIAWRGEPNDDPFDRIFLPTLLDDDSIAILAAYQDQQIVAGAIANRTGEVVGLSNVFVAAEDDQRVRSGCVAAVQERFPGLPIVGYEAGADLTAFQALSFEELGPLRIWAWEDARP